MGKRGGNKEANTFVEKSFVKRASRGERIKRYVARYDVDFDINNKLE